MSEQPSSEPLRIAFSREELQAHAMAYMIEWFGKPSDANDKDQWYERFGMLTHFVGELMDKPFRPERIHV